MKQACVLCTVKLTTVAKTKTRTEDNVNNKFSWPVALFLRAIVSIDLKKRVIAIPDITNVNNTN